MKGKRKGGEANFILEKKKPSVDPIRIGKRTHAYISSEGRGREAKRTGGGEGDVKIRGAVAASKIVAAQSSSRGGSKLMFFSHSLSPHKAAS